MPLPTDDEIAAEIRSGRLRRLFADWRLWRGERAMPSRRDFLPEDIRYILGNIVLHEVVSREPLRFRYRLVGSSIAFRRGFDLTGRFLDEHPDEQVRATITPINERVVRDRRPVWWQFDAPDLLHKMKHCEVLSLPLAANGTDVNIILAAQLFVDEEPLDQ